MKDKILSEISRIIFSSFDLLFSSHYYGLILRGSFQFTFYTFLTNLIRFEEKFIFKK